MIAQKLKMEKFNWLKIRGTRRRWKLNQRKTDPGILRGPQNSKRVGEPEKIYQRLLTANETSKSRNNWEWMCCTNASCQSTNHCRARVKHSNMKSRVSGKRRERGELQRNAESWTRYRMEAVTPQKLCAHWNVKAKSLTIVVSKRV